ncbi:MAG: 3-dehydroquinate synthase, partial [Opitutae bacterium]|nr:3-dehydroquinate synthase [Opitutae bacterium]
MMRETVRVELGARAYEVRIGAGLLAEAGAQIAPLLRRPRVAVLTDETVGALHLEALRAGLGDVAMTALALPAGEATKGWPQFSRAVDWLLAEKVERKDI